jgi:hypothetical protein
MVYCEFGLAAPLPLPAYTPEHFPGWTALQQLIERVAAAIGTDREDPKAFFTDRAHRGRRPARRSPPLQRSLIPNE